MCNIRIKNVNFAYKNNSVFKDINFFLPKNKTLSIIGPSASGKTTLLKLLNNELKYDGNIIINGFDINDENRDIINNILMVVYDNYSFKTNNVKDELRFYLKKNNISSKDITIRMKELDDYFGIKKIANKSIDELSLNDKTLVRILSYAVLKPSYLAIDNLLINLNTRSKILLLNYLNSEKILLINVTSNMDDCLYTDYTICLYNKIIAIDGKTLKVFKEEKLLKRLGLGLPFMIDLSIQLQLYGLINKTYLNKEEMVKKLWK